MYYWIKRTNVDLLNYQNNQNSNTQITNTQISNVQNSNTQNSQLENKPTLHQICTNKCEGNLICDRHRCRQPIGGDCSSTVDCAGGLQCINWVCQMPNDLPNDLPTDFETAVSVYSEESNNERNERTERHVHWQ